MSPIGDTGAIGAEIDRIRSLGVAALRARWRSLFGAPPPDGLTKDLIARMIAYQIQEGAFGGLDRQSSSLWTDWRAAGRPDQNRSGDSKPEPCSSASTMVRATP